MFLSFWASTIIAEQTTGGPKRPQEAAISKAPRPYSQVAVQFENVAAGIRLVGTFSKPKGKGPFPAVLLIAGSGPMTRDEQTDYHRTFLVLADYLNRRGIAVLRYDKRGVGSSGGNFDTARIIDFIDPRHTLEQLQIPVLAVVGSLDHTVIAGPYLSAMRAALTNNEKATVLELPKLNHMFQTAQTGSSTECGQIEETLAPAAMQRIGDWIGDQVKE
jgi:pimeloyl-ACP methyl ester carboxylesterase